jgi:hypothetical protein
MDLRILEDTFAIARLPANAPVPDWVGGNELLAVVRTRTELSIMCSAKHVPQSHTEVQRNFRALVVNGTLDFAQTGIIAQLSAALAGAGISIFSVSTYDTDYLLVPGDKVEHAKTALQAAGHTVR